MNKHILILTMLICFNVKSQEINKLLKNYDNLYALEHIELFTKSHHKRKPQTGLVLPLPPVSHRSLRIKKVNTEWLKKVTKRIKENPKLLLDYVKNENHNLASYILFLEIFNKDMIPVGHKLGSPTFYINILKEKVLDSEEYKNNKIYKEVPENTNPQKYILNKMWKKEAEAEAEKQIRDYINKKL